MANRTKYVETRGILIGEGKKTEHNWVSSDMSVNISRALTVRRRFASLPY